MTIEEIKEMVAGNSYDFLRTNEHLKDRIVFLTLGGSYSYGTNVETSDVDVRGCALNSPSDLLGLTNFEQVVNNETDTTVYSFNKLISLLLSCNPNTIEMLGCKPEHYIYCTDVGDSMIANRKMFLSRRAVDSFGGYATQQLRRLENSLARDKLEQARKEEHILKSMQNAMKSFGERYTEFENGSISYSEEMGSIVGKLKDGTEKNYGDPFHHVSDKIFTCADMVLSGESDPICGIRAASAQAEFIAKLHEVCPIRNANPEKVCETEEKYYVPTLRESLLTCYEKNLLLEEIEKELLV